MFFVFRILILINFVSNSSNFVLKRISQGADGNINTEDGRNNSLLFTTSRSLFKVIENSNPNPNLKVNVFDKKLSDEMLSIKQNIYGRDTVYSSQKTKYTKLNITPRLHVQQKWPEVIKDNRHVDDFNLTPQFTPSRHIGIFTKVKSFSNAWRDNDQSKNKVVDREAPPDNWSKQETNKCNCFQNSGNSPSDAFSSTAPAAGTISHNCNSCTRSTVMFSIVPFYVPYYPPHLIKPTSKGSPHDYLYYEGDGNAKPHIYDVDCENSKEPPKKSSKNDVTDVKCDVKGHEENVLWDTAFLEARPNKLVKDLIDDLYKSYPDSVIKKCYCSSSPCQFGINLSCVVLVSSIFVVVNVLSMY